MSKSIDIDRAAACVRNIVDSNRCGTCDKLENPRRWITCGHVVCEDCAAKEDCVVCLPASKISSVFALDESLIRRANNASVLLNAFEDTFKTDVYRRHRLSEQLKIEKEVFPECIQAPVKYFNKRKSLNTSITNKENRRISFYLGEEVSPSKGGRMEKSKYIQKWLNDSDMNKMKSPRKPFSDISINEQIFSTITNNVPLTKIRKVKNTETILKQKASKIKKSVSKNKKGFSINKYLKTAEQENICQKIDSLKNIKNKANSLLDNTECRVEDESGIVIDDDCVVLDETPTIDKDALALQAVLEADQKESSDYVSFLEHNVPAKKVDFIKVPYFLKSPLYKECSDCNGDITKINSVHHSKNVSITIVYRMTGHKESIKQSTCVQTELSDLERRQMDSHYISSNDSDKDVSQGIFSDVVNYDVNEKPLGENISKKSIIVDESDSELEPESLLVTAEVHRSCEEEDYGVLCDLSFANLDNRKRPSARRTTPASTDSSDKENFDPNRIKRFKSDKKHSKKDKLNYKK